MIIQHLKHEQIDLQRWDQTIQNAANGKIYALSWFLNCVSPGWEALITPDYEFIFPLPITRKTCIKAILQPPFCQQLGLFPSDPDKQEEFLAIMRKKGLFLNIALNHNNKETPNREFRFFPSKNYIIPSNRPYSELVKDFSSNTKRNLKKAHKQNSITELWTDSTEFIHYYLKHTRVSHSIKEIQILKALIQEALKRDAGELRIIKDTKGILLSGSLWLSDRNRKYYTLGFSSPEGMKARSMFLMMDHIIKEAYAKEYIIDFEGSNIPSIERFFHGWGAQPEDYLRIENRWIPIRHLKTLNKIRDQFRTLFKR